MDRSLDEIISERPGPSRGGGRGGRRGGGGDRRPAPAPARAPRREEYPRDGVRKYRNEEPTSIDADWVHDRFEDDRYERTSRSAPFDSDPYGAGNSARPDCQIRVDNLHYDLSEDDLRHLFKQIGPVLNVRMLYDRSDRSLGTAFVTYGNPEDAYDAVQDFDRQNANGQPISVSIVPTAPAAAPRPLFDRVTRAPRSLMERVTGGPFANRGNGEGRRRRERSDSPRGAGRQARVDTDSYVPNRGSRSPIRRRGTPRGGGRRPGARREESAREAPARPARTDEEGRPLVGGRPRKTAEELDAEMADYWGGKGGDEPASNGAAVNETNGVAERDVEMDI